MPQTHQSRSPLRVCATGQFLAAKIKVRNYAVATKPAIFILLLWRRAIMGGSLENPCRDLSRQASRRVADFQPAQNFCGLSGGVF
jgi:hypothetical protein